MAFGRLRQAFCYAPNKRPLVPGKGRAANTVPFVAVSGALRPGVNHSGLMAGAVSILRTNYEVPTHLITYPLAGTFY
jgi:hypothetical protein